MVNNSSNPERIELLLLGGASVLHNGAPLTDIRSPKGLALFIYLACTGRTHTREALADLFWDANSTTQSLSNLRTLLSRMAGPLAGHLVVTRNAIGMNPGDRLRVDAVELDRTLDQLPSSLSVSNAESLGRALQGYKGDFLAEFHIDGAPRWQEWVSLERERLHHRAADGFQQLVAFHATHARIKAGIYLAQQWLALDPLNEAMHLQLMRLFVADGRRAAALEHYRHCCRLLAEEMGIEPGEDMQHIIASLTSEVARVATGSIPAIPHNLPAQQTSLVGRQEEIALIRGQLAAGSRLITLLGEGGIGKTRLALAVANTMVDAARDTPTPFFPDGVWWTPLNSLSAGSHITLANALATAMAHALDLSFSNARESPATQLAAYLRNRTLLLILDDFDELAAGVAYLLRLLTEAPGLHLLVTSRVPLNCQAEQRIAITGLSAPSPENVDVLAAPSARLFLERLRRNDLHVRTDGAMLNALGELCRLVNGSPLALELAAHWGTHFTVADMVTALRRPDLSLLKTDAVDVPPRHRSITAVFETSWRVLSPQGQRLLAQLSVFHGPFSREAALAVSDAKVTHLATLVDHSLLAQPSAGVYELHTLLRQFAGEKLAASTIPGMGRTTRYRHAAHYLKEIGAQAHAVYQPQAPEVLRALQSQLDNIRAAWRWAVADATSAEVHTLLNATWLGMRNYFHVRNLFQEGQELFGWSADRIGARTGMFPLAARLRAAEAFFLNLQHRYAPALTAAQQAAEWARVGGDTVADALAAVEEGITLSNQRHNYRAVARLRQATALADQADRPHAAARALHHSYRNFMDNGDIRQARTMLEMALVRYRRLNYQLAEGFILQSLGYVGLMQCRCLDALANLEQAHAIYLDAGDRPRVAAILPALGRAHEFSGNFDRAQHYYLEAEQWVEQIHDPRYTAELAQRRGLLAWRLGDDEQAWREAWRADRDSRAIGYNGGLMWALNLLGLLHQRQGDYRSALALHQEAYTLNNDRQSWLHWGGVLLGMGRAWCGLRQWPEAAAIFQQAVDLFRRADNLVWGVEACAAQAQVALAQGEIGQALAFVEEVLPVLERNPLHGAFEPATVFLTCYQALRTHQDSRAPALLRQGVRLLQQRAITLQDDVRRKRFLEKVPENRALLAVAGDSAASWPADADHGPGH